METEFWYCGFMNIHGHKFLHGFKEIHSFEDSKIVDNDPLQKNKVSQIAYK